ncbi:MAG: isopenicillin N synthase family dioxygenase [Gammaproteobacteria bacterium]
MTFDTLPVVDLAAFHDGTRAEQDAVGVQLGRICEQIGFFVVSGHGVAESTATRLYSEAMAFFDTPLTNKMSVHRPRNDQNRGYIPYGEETLARMHGGDTPADIKEVFAIGPDDVPDDPYYSCDNAYPSFAPNLWPAHPAALRPAMLAYWSQMERLMNVIAVVMARSLVLPDNYFVRRLERHTSQLRLLHYPKTSAPALPDQLRCGEHTDLGMMTILRNEAVAGGLQLQRRDGVWIDAPAMPETYVVNLGDLMMRWTNDRWKSTRHRVVLPPQTLAATSERLSFGYFVGPDYDTLVECLPTCQSENNPPRYAPVSVHDYRTERFASGAGPNEAVAAAIG